MLNAPTSASHRFQFLDGLRGISISILVLSHAFLLSHEEHTFLFPFFDGDLAVRLFFVASGFIISHFLQLEFEKTGKINLKAFFLKRFSKLFPTLLLYVTTVALLQGPRTLQCTPVAFVTALTFSTGIFLNSCWLLGHTWSLSTEEIFYLSWAPIYGAMAKWRGHFLFVIVVFISPLVRLLNQLSHLGRYETLLAWYRPLPIFPHLDVILWGCVFSLLATQYASSFIRFAQRFQFIPPLAILLTYLSALPAYRMPYLKWLSPAMLPFGYSIQGIAIGYLIAVLFLGQKLRVIESVLSNKILTYLGRISYSLYLWQELCLAPSLETQRTDGWLSWIRIALALAVGALSFHCFEEPVRKFLRRRWKLAH